MRTEAMINNTQSTDCSNSRNSIVTMDTYNEVNKLAFGVATVGSRTHTSTAATGERGENVEKESWGNLVHVIALRMICKHSTSLTFSLIRRSKNRMKQSKSKISE